jgi:hypothetical protein
MDESLLPEASAYALTCGGAGYVTHHDFLLLKCGDDL